MTPTFLERLMRRRLDGTFTRVGGAQETVPTDFMPSHEESGSARHITEAEAASILRHYQGSKSCNITAAHFGISHSTVSVIANGRGRWARFLDQQNKGQSHTVGLPLPESLP